MDHFPPHSIDIFISPIRDSPQAQTALMALLLLIVLDVVLGLAAAASIPEWVPLAPKPSGER